MEHARSLLGKAASRQKASAVSVRPGRHDSMGSAAYSLGTAPEFWRSLSARAWSSVICFAVACIAGMA